MPYSETPIVKENTMSRDFWNIIMIVVIVAFVGYLGNEFMNMIWDAHDLVSSNANPQS
jgi:hypothetical protein